MTMEPSFFGRRPMSTFEFQVMEEVHNNSVSKDKHNLLKFCSHW
jgi:hypothetical protein